MHANARTPRWAPFILMWLALAWLIWEPALSGRLLFDSEQALLYIASVFELTPYYPGSNRIALLLPTVASVFPTLESSAAAIILIEKLILSAGVAALLTTFFRRIVRPVAAAPQS